MGGKVGFGQQPMKATGHISGILGAKGRTVWSVAPDATVLSAIALMAEKNIGAVLVMEGDHPV